VIAASAFDLLDWPRKSPGLQPDLGYTPRAARMV